VPYGDRQTLVISRDVTDLERVETMRRDFIANVSHELRTPLTVLCGFLETIADAAGGDGELLRRSLPLMTEQSRRMQRLVEDLLTLSRLESSHDPPREEEIDVPELVRALHADALALSAGRHRVLLDVATGDRLLGAGEELRSAFGNLVSNAVRYTPDRGEVEIAWRREGPELVFSVRDSGIGIAAQHIPRLTERFYRVDRSRSRETGGTGLGLAIVKHVLNRHQGRLEIASEPGRGSTFSAVFPRERLVARQAPGALAHSA
jgi:two-component system phosphate regulon sensor histidine kinase PhoR